MLPHCKTCSRAEGTPARAPGRSPARADRAKSLVGCNRIRSASGSRCASPRRNGNIERFQAPLALAIFTGNSAARLRARSRNFARRGRSQSYPKVRRIRLRRLFHRYKQGASTAVVQHAELRQSRKTKAMAFGGGLMSPVATRHDKLTANCLAFIQLASIRLWRRVNEPHPRQSDRAGRGDYWVPPLSRGMTTQRSGRLSRRRSVAG